MKSWYSIKAQSDNETEVFIYDEIGFWGVTAKSFIDEFRKIPAQNTILLRINSPGGDVFDGLAIYNVIARHKGEVVATIDGLAASAASVIAMAANKIVMPENAFMLIHNPWGFAIGEAEELRALAADLERVEAALIATYVNRSKQSAEFIEALMDENRLMGAEEAVELHFADEMIAALPIAASAAFAKFSKLDPALLEKAGIKMQNQKSESEIRAEIQKDLTDINAECAKAGVPEFAAELIGKGKSATEVREQLKDAGEIRNICTAARLPDRANDYIKSGLKLEEVRAELLDVTKKRDAIEIDSSLKPNQGTKKAGAVIDTKAIYEMRRKWATGGK